MHWELGMWKSFPKGPRCTHVCKEPQSPRVAVNIHQVRPGCPGVAGPGDAGVCGPAGWTGKSQVIEQWWLDVRDVSAEPILPQSHRRHF